MDTEQTIIGFNVQRKVKDADIFQSMGLFTEALDTYIDILENHCDENEKLYESINEKINTTNKMKGEDKLVENDSFTKRDFEGFKTVLQNNEDVESLLDAAVAQKELGLNEDAVKDYEKLLQLNLSEIDFSKLNCSLKNIICDYLECLFGLTTPDEIIKKTDQIIYNHNLQENDIVHVKFWLGQQMENRNQTEYALELYKKASEMEPDNEEIHNNFCVLISKTKSKSRYDYLLQNNTVTANQLQDALSIAKKNEKSIEYILIDRFQISKDDIGKSLSIYYGCTFRSFDAELPTPYELINNLKKPFLLNNVWVPLKWDKSGIEILIDDPRDLQRTDHVKALMKSQKISFSVAIKEDIEEFIQNFYNSQSTQSPDVQIDNIEDILPDVSFEEEEDLEESNIDIDESSNQIVKFVDQVLVTAFRNGVSDIHVEPSPITKQTTIRFRTDGICQEYIKIPNSMALPIISRLKIMADLDISEKRLPQDGKIKLRRKGIPEFELRISTMPTTGRFEDAVLRILTKTDTFKLDSIGLSDNNLSILKKLIIRPYGMILCVGPTGSGKTTTLHSALANINKPSVKIWTAEDPVEITQAGLRQVQVKPKIGLDFARIMRGLLRLDPDIIMIGEMRDRETASIVIEASLTGHLVFSTLHTNNAPETLTRLLDMGMNPLNIADAFLGVLAQRLVRRTCNTCKESYLPSQDEFQDLRVDFGQKPFDTMGFSYSSDFRLNRSKGCEACNGSGYKGRIGLHELMRGTRDTKIQIKRKGTSEDLAKQAVKDGMITLKQDGICKVIQGITDIKEVRRVCVN